MKLNRLIFVAQVFTIFTLSLISCGGQKGKTAESPNQYSDTTLWYKAYNTPGEYPYDIFYILPTCVWDRVNADGDTIHYADPFNEQDRAAMLPSFALAERIFGDSANFYSPYYSQITLETWVSDSIVNATFPKAMAEIEEAFAYYLEHINGGRPFALAGYSQGGKCVVELLKTLTAEQCEKLIAAYVCGYRVTAEELETYSQIKPAKRADDFGVTICYNTVANVDAILSSLSPSAICINPLNWSTTPEKATLRDSFGDSLTLSIDQQNNVLVAEGVNEDAYYIPALDFLFKKGNLHLQELYFYESSLRENVKLRYNQYLLKNE